MIPTEDVPLCLRQEYVPLHEEISTNRIKGLLNVYNKWSTVIGSMTIEDMCELNILLAGKYLLDIEEEIEWIQSVES